jgi:hypothetical protein
MKHLIGLAAAAIITALTSGAAEAQGTWNAVALDMAGGYTLVTGAASEDDARQQAIDECGNPSCEAVIATESLCLGVADTLEGNYQYGWSYGNTREGVEYISLGYCYESGYPGCKTLLAQCVVAGQSTPPQTPAPKTKTKG